VQSLQSKEKIAIPEKKQVRGGRYRRVLATEAELANEAPLIEERLEPILNLWRHRFIGDAEMAAFYIYIYVSQRRPDSWLGGPHSASRDRAWAPPEKNGQIPAILKIFSQLSVRSVPLPVNHALVRWFSGTYPLTLTTGVPTPEEILRMQCESKRCVTMVVEPDQLRRHILNQRDPLGFLLHDLVHADKFYRNTAMMDGQVGFSRFVYKIYRSGLFDELMLTDAAFKKEIEYVMSDMNSFCVHLLKCLKAVCLGAFLRREDQAPNEKLSPSGAQAFTDFYRGLFDALAPDMTHSSGPNLARVIDAAEKLNSPGEKSPEVNSILCNFFESLGTAPLDVPAYNI
jgi:hypothetical protein